LLDAEYFRDFQLSRGLPQSIFLLHIRKPFAAELTGNGTVNVAAGAYQVPMIAKLLLNSG
jgi:hypothetical protein